MFNAYQNYKSISAARKKLFNNMATIQINRKKYFYLYNQQNPDSLLILSEDQVLIQRLFIKIEYSFVWINQYLGIDVLHYVSSQLKVEIAIQESIQTFTQFIADNKKHGNGNLMYILICSLELKKQVKPLARINQVRSIILCSLNQQDNSQYFFSHFDKFKVIGNKFQLLDALRQQCQPKIQNKDLPNFVPLKKDAKRSYQTVKAIFGMLNYPLCSEMRVKMVELMQKMVMKIASFNVEYSINLNKFKLFIQQMKKQMLTEVRAVYWYTLQSPIYKFINNILRSAKDHTESYYILPFFKDLFTAIKSISVKSKQKKEIIVCYRGGLISQQEKQNFQQTVGHIVQNLGFLSSTTNSQIARKYLQNFFLQIHIKEDYYQEEGVSGFAKVSSLSVYKSEEEIIFNPLNCFKIIEVTEHSLQDEIIWSAKLETCQLQQHEDKNSNNRYEKWIKRMWRNIRQSVTCQGIALFSEGKLFNVCVQYWKKYSELSRNSQQLKKMKSYFNNGKIEMMQSKHRTAIQKFDKIISTIEQMKSINLRQIKIFEVEYDDYEYYYVISQFSKSNCLVQLSHYEFALKQYDKCIGLLSNSDHDTQLLVICLLNNVARVYIRIFPLETYTKKHIEKTLNKIITQGFENDIEHGRCLENIAFICLLQKQKNFAQALQYYQRSASIHRCIFGEATQNYYSLKVIIAELHRNLSHYQLALQILFQCKSGVEELFGKSIAYAHILSQIAIIYQHYEQFQLALNYYFQEEQVFSEIAGNNAAYLLIIQDIGRIYQKSDKWRQQMFFLHFWLKFSSTLASVNILKVINTLNLIAQILSDQQLFSKSVNYYSKSLKLAEKYSKPNQKSKSIVALRNIAKSRLSSLQQKKRIIFPFIDFKGQIMHY